MRIFIFSVKIFVKFLDFIMFFIIFHEKLGEISEIHLIFHLFLVKIRENVNFREKNFSCEFSSNNTPPPLQKSEITEIEKFAK